TFEAQRIAMHLEDRQQAENLLQIAGLEIAARRKLPAGAALRPQVVKFDQTGTMQIHPPTQALCAPVVLHTLVNARRREEDFAMTEAVAERAVDVPTPDGVCDAGFFYPGDGKSHPGIVLYPDVKALRSA